MGSLFKARDWWQYRCGANEEFDRHSMVIANIDNDSSQQQKIVIGSFQGILRIFQPKQKGFKADDLLLEQELDGPILQLGAGYFLSTQPQSLLLAVLNPKKLVVYGVSRSGAGPEGAQDPLGRQYTLLKLHDQVLERCAYNFVSGPFGGSGGAHPKDHICLQTMDGQLSFFEQEKHLFSRFLSNPQAGTEEHFLLPGPLCYNSSQDSFITSTSTFEVQAYRYSTFTSSSGSGYRDGADGKKLRCDWSVNIGEDVVDIKMAKFARSERTSGGSDIVVLGDRTLYVLSENGDIKIQRRLDYHPSCLVPYTLDSKQGDKIQNILVGTHTAQLMVYNDQKLVWSAKTNTYPVSVAVGSFAKLDGLVVMMGEDGVLSCNYLGTDPATQPAQLLDTARELDYDDMDEEHRQLQQVIRLANNAGKSEPEAQIHLVPECPSQLDVSHEKACTVQLFVTYSGHGDVENPTLTVTCPQPFCLAGQDTSIPIDVVKGGQPPIQFPLTFTISSDPTTAALTPVSLEAEVICCYSSPTGDPLTSRCNFFLPLALAGTVVPPVKNPTFKVTLHTNHPPPTLPILFEDVVSGSAEATTPSALTFQYNNSNDATILVSKSANKFRLQASHFESLWLLTSELVRRLKFYFGSQRDGEPLLISYPDTPLPWQEYFQAIDDHFKARQALAQSQQVLSERAHQFRSIQKRLLVRFKDRNPSPLQNLDKLFEATYKQMLSISSFVDMNQQNLVRASNALVCATHLMLLLIQYRFDMRKDDIKVLRHYLSPIVVDSPTQGWEESTDAAMTHLLRTSLAKNAKEATSMPQPLAVPPNTDKLKKHIVLVCDRLAKGSSLKQDAPKIPKAKDKR